MTDAQRATLRKLCKGYKVEFSEDDYHVYPADSYMMPGWAEGWIGGPTHMRPGTGHTIFVGVSPEGDAHS